MWKGSFRARPPSKTGSWRCENEAFARDVLQKLTTSSWQNDTWSGTYSAGSMRVWSAPRVLHPPRGKHSPSTFRGTFCAAKLKACDFAVFAHPLSPKNAFRASLPSKSESRRCGNHVFVRDFFQRLQVEDVELKLSSETSLKNCKLKIWKRSFRARPLSKTEGWRCKNEAFVRDFPSKLKAQDLKMKDSCCSDHHCIDHHCSDNLCCDHHCSDFQSSG